MFDACTGQPGTIHVHTTRDLMGDGELHEAPYYVDSLRPLGLDQSLVLLVETEQPGVGYAFGFLRERSCGAFTDEAKAFLSLVELGLAPFIHPPATSYRAVPHLSPRERDVVRAVMDGLADKEIAVRIGISRHTVNQRLKRIYRAFGVHSRAELMAHLHRASR